MPELAEVEYYRSRWDPGLGKKVKAVLLHPKVRLFRGVNTEDLVAACTGAVLRSSHAAAKQMLFRFGTTTWVGIHLGMTGELFVKSESYAPAKHDHLVFRQSGRSLVFSDFRQFGRVQLHRGKEAPTWWTEIAPALTSPGFSRAAVSKFLLRRGRAPIKAVLLMQEQFPGIGNWMADEILWRAEIHPRKASGKLTKAEVERLHREARWVAKRSLATIGKDLSHPPESWLFSHRWSKGGTCPKTGAKLRHETIGGRTTCWSPGRQPEP